MVSCPSFPAAVALASGRERLSESDLGVFLFSPFLGKKRNRSTFGPWFD